MGGVSTTTAQKLRDSVSKTGPWNYAWRELRLRAADELEALQNKITELKAFCDDVEGLLQAERNQNEALQKELAEARQLKQEADNQCQRKLHQYREACGDIIKLRTQNQELRDQLKEASLLIEKIGTTGVERTDIILKAEQWLKNQP